MNLHTLAAAVRNFISPPIVRSHWVGPAFEPSNISSIATIERIQAATREAENGDTENLFRFYRDALLGDDHIQGEISKRKLAVIGQPLSISPAIKDNEDDIRAAAACQRAIQDCGNWQQALSALLASSMWPVSIAETIYRPADPDPVTYEPGPQQSARSFALQFTIKRIEPVSPMLFCFKHAYFGVTLRNARSTGSSTIDLDAWEPFIRLWPTDDQGRIQHDIGAASPLDPERHIVHRGHLITDQRDNWGGPFRAILAWWLLRGLGRDWFAGFMERYRWPIPIAKTNVEDHQAVTLLQNAFSTCVRLGGLVIGHDDQVNFEEAQVQGGAEGHKLWHDTCNNAISRHITGYGNSEKPAGLNAGEDNLTQAIRADIRILDARLLSETIAKQLFARFLKFNGIKGSIHVNFDPEPAGTLAFKRDVIKAFLADGTVNDIIANLTDLRSLVGDSGIPVNKEYVEPYLPVLTQSGEKVTGGVIRDTEGDIVGGDTRENAATTPKPADNFTSLSATAGSQQHTPIDPIIASRAKPLADAYRGSMAPFRQAILQSTSREDCLNRLQLLYADWPAARLAHELDQALQLCSAAAATKQTRGPNRS